MQMGRAALRINPPNPNKGLDQYLRTAAGDTGPSFDTQTWFNAAKANAHWDAVSWNSVAWSDADFSAVAWSDVSWESVSWETVAWSDVAWSDVAWSDVAWNDVSYEDAAEGDQGQDDPYPLTAEQAAEIMANPDIAPDPLDLPEDVQQQVDGG
jgi:hypothetical protein